MEEEKFREVTLEILEKNFGVCYGWAIYRTKEQALAAAHVIWQRKDVAWGGMYHGMRLGGYVTFAPHNEGYRVLHGGMAPDGTVKVPEEWFVKRDK